MSWFATKHAWRCSYVVDDVELIKGSTKLLLLAIAYRVPQGYYETEPTSLGQFKDLTGIQERQLRNCRDVLMKLGEVEQKAAGKHAVYVLPKMAGPLFAMRNQAKFAGLPDRRRAQNPANITGIYPAKIAPETGKDRRRSAGGVLSSDLSTSNTVRTTTTADETAAVDAFLEWFLAEYPKHRYGVLYTVNPSAAEDVTRRLLNGRSVERLQAMAIRMWAEREDAWILKSDFSLHVLECRAVQLENQVAAAALRVGATMRVPDSAADRLARVVARLRSTGESNADNAIGAAALYVASAIDEGRHDFSAMHVILLTAAAEFIDVDACEIDALAELATFASRMTPEAYDAARRKAIATELLKRANLPNVLELQADQREVSA